ncbi:MAG: hypothetical protein AB3N20_03525 [Rhizobiaceae bacterium]
MTRFARKLGNHTALIAATSLTLTMAAHADFVINDDLIVDGSACIGFDCVNGESFGFDTIRLKEHNLRIKFDDTSTASSFPRTDWQITANASANGGASKFSIDDISGSRTPFTIEANARSHSLYVDDGGRIGIRTSTPSTEIHVIDGDTPTLRLQQDGSSGFAPQTWDVAGNETNFFIRDVTNGSQLPFRIRPGAPTSSIFIDVDGDVGMGTTSPDGRLHVNGTGLQLSYFESSDNNAVQIRMRSDSANRRFLAVDSADSVETQIIFENSAVKIAGPTDSGGDLWATIDANGIVTQGPTCGTPCDAVFDPEVYTVESIDEHAEYMWKNKHLLGVGPTGPNLPFNVTEKTAGILNELEKAHIYIEQLHQRLEKAEKLELAIADLREEIAELKATSQ